MSIFLKKVIEEQPDIIGKTIYFCANKRVSLPCVINDDLTVSPTSAPEKRYDTGNKLADAWKNGEYPTLLNDVHQKISCRTKLASLTFGSDLFLKPRRQSSLRHSVLGRNSEKSTSTKNTEEVFVWHSARLASKETKKYANPPRPVRKRETAQIIKTGIDIVNEINFKRQQHQLRLATRPSLNSNQQQPPPAIPPPVLSPQIRRDTSVQEISNQQQPPPAITSPPLSPVQEINFDQQQPPEVPPIVVPPVVRDVLILEPIPVKIMKQCPGFDRRPYENTIMKKQWNGERAQFSPVRLEGDRCWSKNCEGIIADYRSLCYDCKLKRKWLQNSKARLAKQTPETEERRIIHSGNRYLTQEDQQKKIEYLLKSKQEIMKKLKQQTKRVEHLEKRLKAKQEITDKLKLKIEQLIERLERNLVKRYGR